MTFRSVSLVGHKRTFVVYRVNGGTAGIGRCDKSSTVSILSQDQIDANFSSGPSAPAVRLEVLNIAGIDQALKKLNGFLGNFDRQFRYTWAQRSCAVLLHGGSGTGKTYILSKIADTNWGRVYRLEGDAKPAAIRTLFKDAKSHQPSIIIIDELEALVSKDDSASINNAKVLGEELDNLITNHSLESLPRVVVAAATSDASSIPMLLKKRGRFRTDIPLPIPDAAARRAILRSLAPPLRPDIQDEVLNGLGDRTHAYTAEDLVSLLDTACEIAEDKAVALDASLNDEECFLAQDDIEQALLLVRPTAMHDITLQPPSVRWDEIGGQDSVKKALRRAVETPLLVSQAASFLTSATYHHLASRTNQANRSICY